MPDPQPSPLTTAAPNKPGVGWGFAALGGVFVAVLVSIFATVLAAFFLSGADLTDDLPSEALVAGFVAFAISAGGFAFGLALLAKNPVGDLAYGRVRRWLAVLAGLIANVALLRVFHDVRHPAEDMTAPDSLEAIAMNPSSAFFIVTLMALSLGTISYEFLLRGLALRRFAARWGLPVAIGITSSLDAALDLSLSSFVGGFAISSIAALVAWRAQSTWAAVVVMIVTEAVDLAAIRAGDVFAGRPPPLTGLIVISAVGWLIQDLRRSGMSLRDGQRPLNAPES